MVLLFLTLFTLIIGSFGLNQKKRQEIEDIIHGFEYNAVDFVNGDISQQDLEDFLNDNLTDDFVADFGGFPINGRQNFLDFYIPTLQENSLLSSIVGSLYFVSAQSSSATVRNIDLVSQIEDGALEQFQTKNFWDFTKVQGKFKMSRFSTTILFGDTR